MITTQDLEMIPPILGREKTFAWFPPAYDQYCKVPFKTMAVLEDFNYFRQPTGKDNVEGAKSNLNQSMDNEGSVLSSKLNAIRQELAKKRIVPNMIRQQVLPKPDSIQDYMKIPPTWRPKYPEPDVEILTSIDTKETGTEIKREVPAEIQNERKGSNLANRLVIQRPYTAPGHTLKIHKSSKCSTASSGNRQLSSAVYPQNQKPSSLLQQRLRQTSASESSLNTLRYDKDLEKYRWLMEIPGDPFDIKRPHLPDKQEYFHPISEIKILPQEPSMQKQNRDTFFYNSIPMRSFSFDISPDFMSEKYNKMKNLLRSQGKWNYSSKNFSFVY